MFSTLHKKRQRLGKYFFRSARLYTGRFSPCTFVAVSKIRKTCFYPYTLLLVGHAECSIDTRVRLTMIKHLTTRAITRFVLYRMFAEKKRVFEYVCLFHLDEKAFVPSTFKVYCCTSSTDACLVGWFV